MEFLSYGKQWICQEDIDAVINVLNSDFLTQGPMVKEFENKICDHTGAKYCVAVSNGTAALHLAVASLQIEKDMEGITSPITFLASSNSMIYNGIKPVFADIDGDTYCIDPDEIEKKLTPKTKLIIPVHFAGHPCDMKRIKEIAQKSELYIIEDAAHAIGSKYEDGSNVGNCKYSDLTIFSFHPVKTITSGEGGAITTNNKAIYDKLLMLRNHGMTKDKSKISNDNMNLPWYYEMQLLGFNYRITDIQACLGLSQLHRIEKFVDRRRSIVKKYNNAFKDIKWLKTPFENCEVLSAYHLYVLQIDFEYLGKTRAEVIKQLSDAGIGSQVHYIPVHTQPYYQKTYYYTWGEYPIAEKYYSKALSIPLYPKLTDENVEYIIGRILKLRKG